MNTLAEYLLDLAVILGEPHSVHFDRIEDGSAVPVINVEPESEPQVIRNAQRARGDDAPKHVREAKERVERRLVSHNAKGAEVIDSTRGFTLLKFKGRDSVVEPWGPIRQSGELTGLVAGISERADGVSIRIKDGDKYVTCHSKHDVARDLRPFLLEDKPVRVQGFGKWIRNDQGEWELDEFTIAGFVELNAAPLNDVLSDLRNIKSKWLDGSDPIGEMKKLNDM
jgi:hypothetical protein